MDPIFAVITVLLFAAISLAAWLLVYWVLHDPLPHTDDIDTERPTARKERTP